MYKIPVGYDFTLVRFPFFLSSADSIAVDNRTGCVHGTNKESDEISCKYIQCWLKKAGRWVKLHKKTIPHRSFEGGEGGVLSRIFLQAIPVFDGSWELRRNCHRLM